MIESAAPVPDDDTRWKDEVASRLQNYRARRGTRRPRYNGTLSLDFDRATNRMLNSALAEEAAADAANEFFGASIAEADVEAADPSHESSAEDFADFRQPVADSRKPKAESQPSKIIEFPRLPTLFDSVPVSDLADPVLDKPRILYVPEEVPTSDAPLADIQLVADDRPAAADLDLPLCVAPISQRFIAGLTDVVIVLIGAFVFLAIILRDIPPPDSRLGYAAVAALPAVLWAIYQYLFLVYSAATPGMRMAHLELASFDAEWIHARTRRARAIACILSAFPLGMGIIWALLDDDTLCWHDRISRTYLVPADSEEEELRFTNEVRGG
ncbi:MAG: RDD family protein [Terriglobales bacterium]